MSRSVLAAPVSLFVAVGIAPVVILVAISFFRVENFTLVPTFDLHAWSELLASELMWTLIGRSILFGIVVAALTPIAAYPIAMAMARLPVRLKGLAVIVLLTPLYTGEIVRIYAWRLLLGVRGFFNSALDWLGLIEEPIRALLYTPFSAFIVLFYNNLPFMVLSIWIAVETIDRRLIEAAHDLGASPFRVFRSVVLPLSSIGLAGGVGIVFALAAGDALTPAMMAGTNSATALSMIEHLFGAAFDWPLASALALLLLACLLLCATVLVAAIMLLLRPKRGRQA